MNAFLPKAFFSRADAPSADGLARSLKDLLADSPGSPLGLFSLESSSPLAARLNGRRSRSSRGALGVKVLMAERRGFGVEAESAFAARSPVAPSACGAVSAAASAKTGSSPVTCSSVLPSRTTVSSWPAAISPCTTSRMRERAVSGERKTSISSSAAATLEPRYSETRAERAVGWPAFAPALICFRKRAVVNSQMAGAPSACGTGSTRRIDQSSPRARSTAASVTSRPRVWMSSAAVSGPLSCSNCHVFAANTETRPTPAVVGGCFQLRSPRRV